MSSTVDSSQKSIETLLKEITARSFLNAEDLKSVQAKMSILKDYECWEPLKDFVKGSKYVDREVEFHARVEVAGTQLQFVVDVESAIETLKAIIIDFGLSFKDYESKVSHYVLSMDQPKLEAHVYEGINSSFALKSCQIKCIERLCFLYEKKIYSNNSLYPTYEQLIKLDPKNIKALRFFKMVSAQEGDWNKVTEILENLINESKDPGHRYRDSQELAAVFLYQLSKPKKSLKIVSKYCLDSPLDTSAIEFDAYNCLSDYQGCIRVLNKFMSSVSDKKVLSVLHLRKGDIYEQMSDLKNAILSFEKSYEMDTSFLEPIERMARICTKNKDWKFLLGLLEKIPQHLSNNNLISQVNIATKRLNDCIRS